MEIIETKKALKAVAEYNEALAELEAANFKVSVKLGKIRKIADGKTINVAGIIVSNEVENELQA